MIKSNQSLLSGFKFKDNVYDMICLSIKDIIMLQSFIYIFIEAMKALHISHAYMQRISNVDQVLNYVSFKLKVTFVYTS